MESSADVLRNYGLDPLVELIESSGYGIVVTGDDHTWEYLNPAATRLVGRGFSELRGEDYLLTFPEHERAALLALEGDQREGDTGFYTNTVVRPDGNEVEMTWSGSVMHVGGRELAPAICHETAGLQQARREAAALGALAGQIAAGAGVGDVLAALTEQAVGSTRACGALLLVEDDDVLRLAGRAGVSEEVEFAVSRSSARLADLPGGEFLPRGPVLFSDARRRLLSVAATAAVAEATAGLDWEGAAKFGLCEEGRLVGCLAVLLPPSVTAPSEVELTFWGALADQAAVALGNERLRRQVTRSAALVERQRIARDLHDSVSHALFSVHARAAVIRRALDAGDAELAREAAQDLELLSRQAVAEMRELLVELRPGRVADEAGLVAALRDLAASVRARDGLAVDVDCPEPLPDLSGEMAEHLYRIAREALHNTAKHAAATRAVVRLVAEAGELVLSVQDDGCGFDPDTVPAERLGQHTMRERAALCDGRLQVASRAGQGTTVTTRVPRPA